MGTARRIGWTLAAAAMFAAGCRTPPAPPAVPPPTAPAAPLDLPLVEARSLVPDYRTLPAFDPLTATPADVAPPPTAYRGLTEDVCRREAAARSTAAYLFDRENFVPQPGDDPSVQQAAALLARDVRGHLANMARNRAAAQALDEFFQLADAEGRADAVRESLPILDQLRAIVRKARADGVPVPVEPDELDRQRAALLTGLGAADLGARALDVDLKRRIGAPGRGNERLRPTGPFAVSAETVDPDAAVALALERRPDLRGLRATYLALAPENLSIVRDVIRAAAGPSGAVSGIGRITRPLPILGFIVGRNRLRTIEAEALAEVAVRRQQLFELITEHERSAADEVRASVVALAVQARQVGIARWKAEQLAKKATDAKGRGPLFELPAEVEAARARSEVVTAVMGWHRARVKLAAAQGLLADDAPR
jgi:hypothetical protein